MDENKPFRVNRSALPPNAQTLFNPKTCFAKGGLVQDARGKPVLAGNCQVVQFGKSHTGNDCMFVCQADFSEGSREERPVLASFVFDHQGRVIDLYYGNSAATPSYRTHVHDGTRASFGILAPPPPPPPQQPQIMPMFSYRMQQINDQLKQNAKNMSKDEIGALLLKRTKLKEEYDAEAAEAAEAAKAAREAYDKLIQNPIWGCTRVLKGPLDFVGCERPSVSLVEGVPYVSCVSVHADFDQKFQMSPEDAGKIKPYFEHDPVTRTSKYGSIGLEYYDGQGFENQFGNTGHESFVVFGPDGSIKTVEKRIGHCPHPQRIPPGLSVLNPETRKKFEPELRKGHASVLSEMRALKWLEDEKHRLVFPGGPIDETFAEAAFGWVHDLSMQFTAPAVSLSSAALARMMESSLSRQAGLPGSAKASTPAMFAPAMGQSIFAALATQPRPAKQIAATSCNCTPTVHGPLCKNRLCQYRHARVPRFSFEWPRRIVSGRLLTAQIDAKQDDERTKKLAAEGAEATRVEAADAKKAAAAAKREAARQAAEGAEAPAPQKRKTSASASASASASSKKKKGGSKSKSKSKRRVRK